MNSPHDPELVDRPLDLPPTTHMQRYERLVRKPPPLEFNCFLEYETACHEAGGCQYKGASWRDRDAWLGVLVFFYLCVTTMGPIILCCLAESWWRDTLLVLLPLLFFGPHLIGVMLLVIPLRALEWLCGMSARLDGGYAAMKTDEVLDSIARKPFRAFTINLLDGEPILIDSPHAILCSERKPELLIAFTRGWATCISSRPQRHRFTPDEEESAQTISNLGENPYSPGAGVRIICMRKSCACWFWRPDLFGERGVAAQHLHRGSLVDALVSTLAITSAFTPAGALANFGFAARRSKARIVSVPAIC